MALHARTLSMGSESMSSSSDTEFVVTYRDHRLTTTGPSRPQPQPQPPQPPPSILVDPFRGCSPESSDLDDGSWIILPPRHASRHMTNDVRRRIMDSKNHRSESVMIENPAIERLPSSLTHPVPTKQSTTLNQPTPVSVIDSRSTRLPLPISVPSTPPTRSLIDLMHLVSITTHVVLDTDQDTNDTEDANNPEACDPQWSLVYQSSLPTIHEDEPS